MSIDETEQFRRARISELASQQSDNRAELEARHGKVWDTEQLRKDFVIDGFMAPYVIVHRKSDGAAGSLEFQHEPRFYFRWQEDHD